MGAHERQRGSLLLVEDDPIHVEIVDFHLGKIAGGGFDVTVRPRLEDALEHLRATPTDFVLLDLTLPDSELEETLERIPEVVERGAVVVAMSSLDAPGIAETARAHGATAFLVKSTITAERLAACFEVAAASAGSPPESHTEPITAAKETPAPAKETSAPAKETSDAARLVSKLAHDASSWLTNQSFRLAAMETSLDDIDRDALEAHVRSLRSSAEALGALVEGARNVAEDELTDVAAEPIDLAAWLARREIAGPEQPVPVRACETGLGHVFEALARNAAQHGEAAQDDARGLRVLEGRVGGGATEVDVVDDGGPWDVAAPDRLPEPLVKGSTSSVRAGLGLYRARRWMERMGGGLAIVERTDAPGAFAVRLRFPSASPPRQ
ncbi:MAG: response regulator [Planctomycetota bacterium]